MFTLESASSYNAASGSSASTSTSCTTNPCRNVIKQVKLFFIKSTSGIVIDASNSYLVVGDATINGASYYRIMYSYQFQPSSGTFPFGSNVAYAIGAPLQLMMQTVVSGNSVSFKVFNPVNLAFSMPNGNCRIASSQSSDLSSFVELLFGVNSVYSCTGTNSFISNNLQLALNYVGSIGSATSNSNDYVQIEFSSSLSNSQNVQLIFYYIPLGVKGSAQYKIVKAMANAFPFPSGGQPSLFVEYQ